MQTNYFAVLCAVFGACQIASIASADELGIFSCFEGDGYHARVVQRVASEMSRPASFQHLQTRIDAGFDNGEYSGKHFLEMFYGGPDVASGEMSERVIETVSIDDCSVGLFLASAPK